PPPGAFVAGRRAADAAAKPDQQHQPGPQMALDRGFAVARWHQPLLPASATTFSGSMPGAASLSFFITASFGPAASARPKFMANNRSTLLKTVWRWAMTMMMPPRV